MLRCRCDVLLALCMCPLACLALTPCPPGCCCPRPGFLVLCESLGLRSLPRSVPLDTSALSVARNQLCNVDHLLRRFSGLTELSLSHNLLERFPRGLPPSLESLTLRENRITYITAGALRQLGNLTRLDLEDNRIRAIQPGALLALTELRVLTLKGNKLTSLPPSLPPSLTHLDLSENCISSLDLPSLSGMVNLQVLKINSNCLRSVPEKAFDSLPRLRSVDLANNLWVCECDILYLYRWLLRDGLKTASALVCKEPVHLAQRLLLNLSVMSICPHFLKPNERRGHLHPNSLVTMMPRDQISYENNVNLGDWQLEISEETTFSTASNVKYLSKSRVLHYSLETLTYEECLSLNKTHSVSQSHLRTTTALPEEAQRCRENATAPTLQGNASAPEGTQPWLSIDRDEPSAALTQQHSAAIVSLLAVLCMLTVLLMLAVLLVLKLLLVHQQRVAPARVGSGE